MSFIASTPFGSLKGTLRVFIAAAALVTGVPSALAQDKAAKDELRDFVERVIGPPRPTILELVAPISGLDFARENEELFARITEENMSRCFSDLQRGVNIVYAGERGKIAKSNGIFCVKNLDSSRRGITVDNESHFDPEKGIPAGMAANDPVGPANFTDFVLRRDDGRILVRPGRFDDDDTLSDKEKDQAKLSPAEQRNFDALTRAARFLKKLDSPGPD